jgi:alpha-beta hydrolase superfamily lysophospholipase
MGLEGRGTSEVGEFGMIVGDPLVARVKRDMPGENVRGYPVQYSSTEASTQKGVADVQKRLDQQIKECPDQRFALVGYSQGGVVMLYAARRLTPAMQEKTLAVVLYGAGNGSSIADPFKPKLLVNCAPGDIVS